MSSGYNGEISYRLRGNMMSRATGFRKLTFVLLADESCGNRR
jgi:hypothetical protein